MTEANERPGYSPAFRRGIAPRQLWLALAWLAVGLILTGLASLYLKAEVEAAAQREFDFIGNEIRLNIADRLAANAQILRSGAALFEASETVTRQEWRAFTQGLQVEPNLPGTQGIGFAQLIPREQLARHIQDIRRQGFPDYQVRPEGDRETYTAIIYLEPFEGRNLRAFGYDMFSEPVRRAAMERARDEDSAALSGKVILVQETDQDVQAGALMYVPVYRQGASLETVEQRRAALRGWVYSPYRLADLMRGTLLGWEAKQQDRQITLQVYDGQAISADTLLFDSQSAGEQASAATGQVTRLVPVDFGGRQWTLRFTQLGGLASTADYDSVWLVLFGGTIISLLFFWLALSLLNTRAKARQRAEELTTELRESEQSYRNQFANNSVAMLLLDSTDGAILEANAAALSFYGYPRERLLAMRITDLSLLPAVEVGQAMASVLPERGQRFEFQHRLADGSIREVEVSSSQIQFGGRTVLHSIIYDITERQRVEAALRESERFARSTVDSLSAHIAILDENGCIVAVNRAWRDFASANLAVPGRVNEGANYLSVCNVATGPGSEGVKEFTSGILAVLHGERDRFTMEYPCHSPTEQRWFISHVVRFSGEGVRRIVVTHENITERKRAEEIIAALARRNQTLLQTASDGIHVLDEQGDVVEANAAFCTMLGYTPEELLLLNVADWDAQWSGEELVAKIGELIAHPAVFETRQRRKDGAIREVEINAVGVLLEGRRYLYAAARDITERKQAEEALQAASLYARNLIETSLDPLVTISAEGKITDVNLATEKITGLSRARLIGTDFAAYFTEPKLARAGYLKAFVQGQVIDCPLAIRHTSGAVTEVLFNASVYRNEQGEVGGVFAAARDITERKLAAEVLRESEEKYRMVADFTFDWEAWRAPNGTYQYVSPSCERISGHKAAKFLADPNFILQITHPNDRSKVSEHYHATAHETETQSLEFDFRILTPSGETRWISHVCTAVYAEGGQWLGRRESNRDITDRKQAEVVRAKLEDQTQQIKKAKSLSRMAGAIAHHFNNQLQAVMGNLELAMRSDTSPQNLSQAMVAAGRAAEMSGLMLVYLGQTPDRLEPLNLAATIARSLPALRETLAPGVTLETDFADPGPVINANATRIRQLLTNLGTNAGEAMGDTPGTIHLTLKTVPAADIPTTHRFPFDWQPQDQAYACLEVTDTGVGIAPDDIEKLFDPFYSTKFIGRGLGLAVVLGIIRSHSGAVAVTSQPGRGSTFRLFFPAIASIAPPPPVQLDQAAYRQEMAEGGTVLLVEDEETVRHIVAEMLAGLGFTVLTAADGVEAVELFRQHQGHIGCVLSDLAMPRMDGWETLTALRELAPDLPVILSSGYDEAQVMAGHHPQLPQAFLNKPYKLSTMNQVIRRVLAERKMQS